MSTPKIARRGRAAGEAVRPSEMLVAFFAPAVLMLALAAAVATAGVLAELPRERWLILHLAFLGGVSQLVLGAAQFFVCAFLATDPPSRRLLRGQLATWNAGVVAIAVGVPSDITALTAAGGVLVLATLGLFALALGSMERRSLQRAPWAARWYRAAGLFLATGAVLGPLLAGGVIWTHGSLLAAHMAMNQGGWFGTAIVGTLHTFYPSLTGTRLRWPVLQPLAFAGWSGGIVALALGCAIDGRLLAAAGWAGLGAAAVLLVANLLASALRARQTSVPAALVGAAQLFLLAALAAGFLVTLDAGAAAGLPGAERDVVATLAVQGWIGLTVAGSLLHLLALMGRVRGPGGPAPAPTRSRRGVPLAVASAALLAVSALAAARAAEAGETTAAAAVALLYGALGARVLMLAVRAVRAAPLRI